MTLTAYTFVVTNREADTLGLAAVSVESRYVSVRLRGADRLLRRHPSQTDWREIEHTIATGIGTKPMASGVFHDVLVAGAEDRRVQYLLVTSIDVKDPLETVQALDMAPEGSAFRRSTANDSEKAGAATHAPNKSRWQRP